MLTPEQIAEGWIEHDGGPCPVPLDSKVDVMFRDGSGSKRRHRAQWWTAFNPVIAAQDLWRHEAGPENDIIAYRPEPRHD